MNPDKFTSNGEIRDSAKAIPIGVMNTFGGANLLEYRRRLGSIVGEYVTKGAGLLAFQEVIVPMLPQIEGYTPVFSRHAAILCKGGLASLIDSKKFAIDSHTFIPYTSQPSFRAGHRYATDLFFGGKGMQIIELTDLRDGAEIVKLNTHCYAPGEVASEIAILEDQLKELRSVVRAVSNSGKHVILCGDFNTELHSDLYHKYLGDLGVVAETGPTVSDREMPLDLLISTNGGFMGSQLINNDFSWSDHRGIFATLEIEP